MDSTTAIQQWFTLGLDSNKIDFKKMSEDIVIEGINWR